MEQDISIWRKTGHFYFALTVPTRRIAANNMRLTPDRILVLVTGKKRRCRR